MAWVAILMGSESDWPVIQSTTSVLKDLGVEFEVKVSSAHRTPEETRTYISDAESRGCGVFICAAGMAAHLAIPILGEWPSDFAWTGLILTTGASY